MNSISLSMGSGMTEQVSGERFATLENEVKHITSDVSEIKGSVKTTEKAMASIDTSIALLAKSVEQNKTLGPRIHNLETKVSKVELKMAAYAGGIAALSLIVMNFAKIKAFFV